MSGHRKLIVLLVEDDIDDIFICRTALERAKLNMELHIARSIEDGINWLAGDEPFNNRRVFPFPDMVITDLKAGDVSGLELVRWARGRTEFRDIPIVVHSGSYHPGQADECLKAGATAAYVKEPLCQQLVEAVNQVMAGA